MAENYQFVSNFTLWVGENNVRFYCQSICDRLLIYLNLGLALDSEHKAAEHHALNRHLCYSLQSTEQ